MTPAESCQRHRAPGYGAYRLIGHPPGRTGRHHAVKGFNVFDERDATTSKPRPACVLALGFSEAE